MTSATNNCTGRPLRVLIVDDNDVNLSILSTLLKQRFSHVIEGAPITVDSGIKAIQLLRTHVFDCIFMDIQMPFLNGLEASRIIRSAEDGVLPANSDAHIVAVTTAVGIKPELAYRRANMDGMIGKPVCFQDLHQYLIALAHEAFKAAKSEKPLMIDGEAVMPPLPPSSKHERVFYLPCNTTVLTTRPDICDDSDFEQLLEAQTLVSLHQHGPSSVIGSASHTRPARPAKVGSKGSASCQVGLLSQCKVEAMSSASSRSNSFSSLEEQHQCPSYIPAPPPATVPLFNGLKTISRHTLSKQDEIDISNADLSENSAGDEYMPSFNIHARSSTRPTISHWTTSLDWSLDDDGFDINVSPRIWETPSRPSLFAFGQQDDIYSFSSGTSGTASSDLMDDAHLFSPSFRSGSQTSLTSICSDVSSTVTKPPHESDAFFSRDEQGMHFGEYHDRHHSSNTIGLLYSDGYFPDLKET